MKLNGIIGKGTGKLGSSVFAISGGEQVVREYNPVVSNPSTAAQVAQRAKLKLMSQLAAAFAPGIAFKKKGLVSARNQFVSANIQYTNFSNGKADITMSSLTLTGSLAAFPELTHSAGTGEGHNIALSAAAPANVDAVVYVVAAYDAEEQVKSIDVQVIETPGDNRLFPATFTATGDKAIVYGYGLIGASRGNGNSYGDYGISMDDQVASLETVTKLIKSAANYTKTTSTGVVL